jgi:hypothetical protein
MQLDARVPEFCGGVDETTASSSPGPQTDRLVLFPRQLHAAEADRRAPRMTPDRYGTCALRRLTPYKNPFNLPRIPGAPFAQRCQRLPQSPPKRRERILDPRRDLAVIETSNDPIRLQLLELLNEYLVGHTPHGPP